MIVPAVLWSISLLGVLVLLVRYVGWTTWYHHPEGWCLAATLAVVAIQHAVALSVVIFGLYPGVQIARTVAAALAAVTFVGAAIAGFWIQRNGNRSGEG